MGHSQSSEFPILAEVRNIDKMRSLLVLAVLCCLALAQEPELCNPDNACAEEGLVCCWEEFGGLLAGCCAQGFQCCESTPGDEHDCCPVTDEQCNVDGGANCYYNAVYR